MSVVWYSNQYVIEGSAKEAAEEISAIVLAASSLDLGVRIENVWVPDESSEGYRTMQWIVTREDGGEVPDYAEWDGANPDSDWPGKGIDDSSPS